MNRKPAMAVVVLLLLLSGGCIVSDKLTTLTIKPDGSADLVLFRSNIRSTEKGEKAEKELAGFRTRFESQKDEDAKRILEAGGEILKSLWVRDEVPFSTVVHARFAKADELERYWTIRNPDGTAMVTTEFRSDGNQRNLVFHITVPAQTRDGLSAEPTSAETLRKNLANGISECRIAVADGSITSASGFTIANDRQSALLNTDEVGRLLHAQNGSADLTLTWDVTR